MQDNKFVFRPMRGTNEEINKKPIIDGYIYFAYDTGNIYLDKLGVRHVMGGSGSNSIIYADGDEQEIVKITDDELDATYYISFSALENPNVLPLKDNLILNSDGKFFRVNEIDQNNSRIIATLLIVSGGSGDEEGPVKQTVDIIFDSKTIETGSIYIYKAEDSNIRLTPKVMNGNIDTQVKLTFTINDRENPENSSIFEDVAPIDKIYLFPTAKLPLSNNIYLSININSDNSGLEKGKTYNYSISTVDMQIKKYNPNALVKVIRPNQTEPLVLDYVPIGSSKIITTLHVYVDDNEIKTETLVSGQDGNKSEVSIPRQSHGVHTIDLALSAKVNDNKEIYTPKIRYQGAWASAGDNSPIIWLGEYDETIINYNPSYINFMLYDPETAVTGGNTEVQFFKEAALVNTMEIAYKETGWYTYDISAIYTLGDNNFTITCRGTKVDLLIKVTNEGARDLSLSSQESLLLNYSSAGKSNAEIVSSRTTWLNQGISNESIANLVNFNWQNNGWNRDIVVENEIDMGTYLSIANGSSVNISCPSCRMNGDTNYSIEMRFRIRNAYQYSTLISIKPKYFYTINGVLQSNSLYEEEIENKKDEGYAIAVDKDGYLMLDEANSTQLIETENGVVCKWCDSHNFGLFIGTQEAYFKSPNGIVSVKYTENEVITLSCVISKQNLVYIYLNGILSGASVLPESAGTFTINSLFEFNSKYCDIDLYRLRVYSTELTMPQVIHNYLSDIHNIELYDQNQLTNSWTPTELEYQKIIDYNKEQIKQNNVDGLTMPYAVWKINDTVDNTERLPYFKGNTRYADITFVNPTADYLLDQGLISEWEYYTGSPSFTATGVDIDVQGTSSQGYPRRNYKTKFKSAKETWVYTQGSLKGKPLTEKYFVSEIADKPELVTKELSKKFHMDNEFVGTNKFTWKIDYMESSGKYNTGFADLMGNKAQPLYNFHPLKNIGYENESQGMRTTIYGFPVLVFHEYANTKNNPTNNNTQYEYIGRYNFNLDKGSNEYFGFELEEVQKFLPEQEYTIQQDDGTTKTEIRKPYVSEIAECWELADNQGTWCSFRFPTEEARVLGFGSPQDEQHPDRLEVLRHFEHRYSFYEDQLDGISDGGNYDLADPDKQKEYWLGQSDAVKSQFARDKYKNLEKVFKWLDSTDTSNAKSETLLEQPITWETSINYDYEDGTSSEEISANNYQTTFTKDTRGYRITKFKQEFNKHFNSEYCLLYFIITELLMCYDSRGKNMMLASFGPEENNGEYIWYPLFYDIDTQMGINNSGAPLWDYSADVTEKNIFSTPNSVLWNNLYEAFFNEIKATYISLRSGNLTAINIIGAYETDPKVFQSLAMKGIRPIIAIGLDEYYKYLASKKHYFNTEGQPASLENPPSAMQGDKKLTIQSFLENRLNYMDSWLRAGIYSAAKMTQTSAKFRGNANNLSTSDKYLDTIELPSGYQYAQYPKPYLDAQPGYQLKPFLKQYVHYWVDDNTPSTNIKYTGSIEWPNGIWTPVPDSIKNAYKSSHSVSQQLNYIPGLDYLSSLGDLSSAYIDEIFLFGGKKLLDLIIGSDHPNYSNNLLNASSQMQLNTSADNQQKKELLQKIVLTNLTNFKKQLDFTGSKKLKEFRALNTLIDQAYFAGGAPISILHLPKTIQQINLNSMKELKNIIRKVPIVCELIDEVLVYKEESEYSGLYIEGITDYQRPEMVGNGEGHALNTLIIEGGSLNYDSYEILDNLIYLKNDVKFGIDNTLKLKLTDVVWTPYSQVEYGENYDSEITYYYLNDHNKYIEYLEYYKIELENITSEDEKLIFLQEHFKIDTNNGLIYILNFIADTVKQPVDLNIFDKFVYDYDSGIGQYSNPDSGTELSVPTITGNIHINNTENNPIQEIDLTNIYKVKFPRLTITANYITEANITKYVEVLPETGRINIIDTFRTNENSPSLPNLEKIPTRANHTFKGWSTTTEVSDIIIPYNGKYPQEDEIKAILSQMQFDDSKIITFYAIFEIQSFNVRFYMDNNLNEYKDIEFAYNDLLVLPNRIPYKDDTALDLDKTYKFMGYSTLKTDMENDYISQTIPSKVFHELTLYPVFNETSVYDNVLDQKYFNFNTTNHILKLNIQYKNDIKGKITLPTTYNGVAVWELGQDYGVTDAWPEITHIFWDKNNNNYITGYGAYAVTGMKKLVYAELPNYNSSIKTRAFQNCNNLFNNNKISKNHIDNFFNRIKFIGELAFNSTKLEYTDKNTFVKDVPIVLNNIETIERGGLSATCIKQLTIGSPNNYINKDNLGAEIINGTYYTDNNNKILDILIYTKDNILTTDTILKHGEEVRLQLELKQNN